MKKNAFLSALLLFGFSGFLTGCHIVIHTLKGNGNIVSEERTAGSFNIVLLEGVADVVNIHHDEDYRVTVTTDSNIQDIVEITADGNILKIDEKHERGGFDSTKLIIDVYMPELKEISLKGVGNFQVVGGNTSDLRITLSGVGNINAQDYEAKNVNITLSGVGNIKTWATESLSINFSGIGDILYKGNPPVKNISGNGIGKIEKM
jgi:hypothetical protein